MTDQPPVLAVEHVTKRFRDFWGRAQVVAVDDLNLTLSPGEVVGLLGPNGSGKSTTIKLILGLLRPDAGRISVLGRPPTDVRAKERLGYLPEETWLYPYLSASETLDFFGRLVDLPAGPRRARTAELLELVGLTGVRSRRAGQFSKGMQRRLGLAQALLNDPDVILLDEPTSGLDPLGCAEVKQLVRLLADRGKAVLMTSHLLADTEEVCDRVVVLYSGRTLAAGSLDDLLGDQTRWTAELPALDPPVWDQVRAAIAAAAPGAEVSVRPRRLSLESYFTTLIEQARAGGSDDAASAEMTTDPPAQAPKATPPAKASLEEVEVALRRQYGLTPSDAAGDGAGDA